MRGSRIPYATSTRRFRTTNIAAVKKTHRLHDGVVAAVNGLDRQPPDPGPRKDRLRDHRTAQQIPELQSHDGDDGDRCVPHGVLRDGPELRQALGAGRPDEVGPQDLQHRRSSDAGDARHGKGSQRHRRQDHVPPIPPARGRKQPEPEGTHQDEHDADVKGRGRLADQRHPHHDVVVGAPPLDRREDPGRNGHRDGAEEGREGQLQRRGYPLPDHGHGRGPEVNGAAEVSFHCLPDEYPVLNVDRPVQAHLAPQPLHLGDGGIRRQQERHRVAREAHDDEDHRHHAPQGDQHPYQPVRQEPRKALHGHLGALHRPRDKNHRAPSPSRDGARWPSAPRRGITRG